MGGTTGLQASFPNRAVGPDDRRVVLARAWHAWHVLRGWAGWIAHFVRQAPSRSPSSTAERRTKRRQNQAREGCVAQASCAQTFCPPAAKTGAAQSEGRTVLSKPGARRVERARRGRRGEACSATVPSATSVRAGGSLSTSVSHTVVAWRCVEDRTLTGAPHRVRGRTLARGCRTACSGGLPSFVLVLDAVRPVHHHEGAPGRPLASFWYSHSDSRCNLQYTD